MEKTVEMSLSLSGCGFLGLYYSGVAAGFKKYAPHIRFTKISGASAGALAGTSLLCNMEAEEYITDMLDFVNGARMKALGPYSPSFNLNDGLRKKLMKLLPDDAHVQVSGRIFISLTRVHDGKNVTVSEFDSKEELIDCLLASCFVPIFSGLIPQKFRGVRYIDGMYTNNSPGVIESTVTISPFSGESDICPPYDSTPHFHLNFSGTSIAVSSWNIMNFRAVLWPPSSEIIAQFCSQGYRDVIRFLTLNGHISCKMCLSIPATYVMSKEEDEAISENDPQCEKCVELQQEAAAGSLPNNLETIFHKYNESINKRFYNRLLSGKGGIIVSVLTLPYTVPMDCVHAFIILVKKIFPHVKPKLQFMHRTLIEDVGNEVSNNSLSTTLKTEHAVPGDTEHSTDEQIKIDHHVDDNQATSTTNSSIPDVQTPLLSENYRSKPGENTSDCVNDLAQSSSFLTGKEESFNQDLHLQHKSKNKYGSSLADIEELTDDSLISNNSLGFPSSEVTPNL